jgi:DNA-binding transcriptional ArsR family regulator
VEVCLTAIEVSPYTAAMDESKYRESRICRLFGNPVIYQLVVLLDDGGPLTPSNLAKLAGRSVQTVSGHLAKLRAADIVRYDTAGKEVRYWLKHRGETRALLKALEKIIHASGQLA